MAREPKLFMWAGGKGKMLTHYAPHLYEKIPPGGYVEPFAGGAALFAHLRRTHDGFRGLLGDVNSEIMALYAEVRDNPDRLIALLQPYARAWENASENERKELYYNTRRQYWTMDNTPESVATLYALMRTGFNGIWQTCLASGGKFGTPVGLVNKKTPVFDATAVHAWSGYLKNTDLHVGGYETMNVPLNAFVFCDPPYRDSFTTYGTGFDDAAQLALVEWCRTLNLEKGCKVWLANRDAEDGFFERCAPDARILRFPVTYTAGRRKRVEDGFEAKPATELLLMWDKT